MSTLEIRNLHAQVLPTDESAGPKEILKGVNLTINLGETHAMMGPNGSGKFTLSYTIIGHPYYEVTESEILLDGKNVLEMSVDEHTRAGLFLAVQHPMEATDVSMSNFLRSAATTVHGEAPKLRHWVKEVREATADLEVDSSFSRRSVNEGFSGGEKKRHEILQLDLLRPKFAILDETDSGLDVDVLHVVSEGTNRYQDENDGGILIITHYQRILDYVKPDFVHVFHDNRFTTSGDPELADELEEHGYEKYVNA